MLGLLSGRSCIFLHTAGRGEHLLFSKRCNVSLAPLLLFCLDVHFNFHLHLQLSRRCAGVVRVDAATNAALFGSGVTPEQLLGGKVRPPGEFPEPFAPLEDMLSCLPRWTCRCHRQRSFRSCLPCWTCCPATTRGLEG